MSNENFTTWTEVDPGTKISATSSTITITGYDGPSAGSSNYFYKDQGAGFYSGNFTFRYGPIQFTSPSSNNASAIILRASLVLPDDTTKHSGSVQAYWQNTATNATLYLREYSTTNTTDETPTTEDTYQGSAVNAGTSFYIEFQRTGTTMNLRLYSDAYSTLVDTLTFTLSQAAQSYRYVLSPASRGIGSGATVGGTFQNLDLAAGSSPATLSGATPSGTLGTTTSATLGATTDQTSGTLYGVVDTAGNITGISAAQVKAAQNNAGGAPVASGNSSVSSGSPSVGVTGLTANTAYSYALVQNNANGDSNVITGTFTTASAVNLEARKYGPQGAMR